MNLRLYQKSSELVWWEVVQTLSGRIEEIESISKWVPEVNKVRKVHKYKDINIKLTWSSSNWAEVKDRFASFKHAGGRKIWNCDVIYWQPF